VITANEVPDHSTLARFRRDHEDALAGLFTGVLALCAKAGLVNVGVIAVDGTKLHANASDRSNLTYEQIAATPTVLSDGGGRGLSGLASALVSGYGSPCTSTGALKM
jgi:hypothetical protein